MADMFLPDMMQPKPWTFLFLRALALGGLGASFCLAVMAAGANDVPTNSPTVRASPAPAQDQTLHFLISHYEVTGNTLLPGRVLEGILSKHAGTNMTFVDVAGAVKELQLEYHNRGYDTISVTIPQQRLTNGVFKLRVFQGRLAEIVVTGNRYFSSNNVMRALPGLKPYMYMNSRLLQPQLDLANANQDRQIYPEIHPGPDPETTSLMLRIKDQLPLHAKLEANNQSTPGTPDMRLAASAAYDNLWQLEHSMGVQYTFSEEKYKEGGNWSLYDRPLVANYSGFYRLPLAGAESVADATARSAGQFGYNEATRKFVLPPATGAPELNLYASGSTIDTGVLSGSTKTIFAGTNGSSIDQQTIHQDLTYNNALGFRATEPLPEWAGFRSHLQLGLDFKDYKQVSFETNNFITTEYLENLNGQPYTQVSVLPSPVPATSRSLSYLPLTLHWDVSRNDALGATSMGMSYSPNLWYSGARSNVQSISSSTRSSGFWHVLTGNASREQALPGQWKVALRADGQWASEPLISNEEFGAGGIAGVRGYREGEVFGDSGWRVTSELKLPSYRIGFAGQGASTPLIVRTSLFMDYADTYLLDPQGRPAATPLWGTGVAGAASLGTHFHGMLSLAWPLLSTPTSEAYHVRIAFSLIAQF
jgi:hemolysin activation/secretion protein